MPSSANTAAIAAPTSGSSSGASRSRTSTTVTLAPSRANNWACSSPTALPPTTSSDRGSSASSIAMVEVR